MSIRSPCLPSPYPSPDYRYLPRTLPGHLHCFAFTNPPMRRDPIGLIRVLLSHGPNLLAG